VFGTRASVANEPSAVEESPLPQDFDPLAPHTLRIDKSASGVFTFFLDDTRIGQRTVPLVYGQFGLFARNTTVRFRSVQSRDTSFGWVAAQGE
jgi:hypothetical protein